MSVRCAPKADKRADVLGRPLSTKIGLVHRNKRRTRGCNDLLNHLVGGGLQRKRHGKAERLCVRWGPIRPPEIKLYRLSEAADSRV
jgi:hypothetical protein